MSLLRTLRSRLAPMTYAKRLLLLGGFVFLLFLVLDYAVFPESPPNPGGDLVAALMAAGFDAWIDSVGEPDPWPRLAQLLVTVSLLAAWLVVGIRDLKGPRQDSGTLWLGGMMVAFTVGELVRNKFRAKREKRDA